MRICGPIERVMGMASWRIERSSWAACNHYRVRIGKGRFCYGESLSSACERALKEQQDEFYHSIESDYIRKNWRKLRLEELRRRKRARAALQEAPLGAGELGAIGGGWRVIRIKLFPGGPVLPNRFERISDRAVLDVWWDSSARIGLVDEVVAAKISSPPAPATPPASTARRPA